MMPFTEKQRTLLLIILIIALVAAAFTAFLIASTREVGYIYVVYADENGFMGNINGLGRVYVEYPDAGERFDMFDTVRVTWRAENLREESGTVTSLTGNPDLYEFVIAPSSVRKSAPWLGEPLYD